MINVLVGLIQELGISSGEVVTSIDTYDKAHRVL